MNRVTTRGKDIGREGNKEGGGEIRKDLCLYRILIHGDTEAATRTFTGRWGEGETQKDLCSYCCLFSGIT